MPLLTPDVPYGSPPFALSDDQIATVIDLVCRGAHEGRADVTPGMLEVPATIVVRKAMRRVKKALGFTNLQVRGEHELEDMATTDPTILGRIDITLQFLHQFGDEDAYVAIECKRVRAGDAALNGSYVANGVNRFVTGQYAAGHEWAFMLGYVLKAPIDDIVTFIDTRLRNNYGDPAALHPDAGHPNAMAVLENAVVQNDHHPMRLKHIFVDLLPAA